MSDQDDAQRESVARDWDYITVGLLLNPINKRLAPAVARSGIHPNFITIASFLAAVGAGVLWVLPDRYDITASILLLVSFWLDGLDGHVARVANKTSRWGAALDAVLDRVGECVVVGCISAGAWIEKGEIIWPLFGFVAIGALQVYYYTVDRFLVPNLEVSQRALVPLTRRLRPGLMEIYYIVLVGLGLAGLIHYSLPVLAAMFLMGFLIQIFRIWIVLRRSDD